MSATTQTARFFETVASVAAQGPSMLPPEQAAALLGVAIGQLHGEDVFGDDEEIVFPGDPEAVAASMLAKAELYGYLDDDYRRYVARATEGAKAAQLRHPELFPASQTPAGD